MVAPSRVEQQRLGDGVPTIVVTRQQQLANGLGAGRPTRLTRRDGGDSGACQCGNEEGGLGRFAGSLPAFKRNKPAARAQRRVPQIR
jgi:hypothetical protein